MTRLNALIQLIDSYLENLSETDLYKVLDLLRNTDEQRTVNKITSKVNAPLGYSSDNIKYTGSDPYIDSIVSKIESQNLNTAHYGILISTLSNPHNNHLYIQVNFGVVNKFDAQLSVWNVNNSYKLKLIHEEFTSSKDNTFYPLTVDDGLTRLASTYNILAGDK